MVKIKLFLTDTTSYVSLDLNNIAENTHLLKLTGEWTEKCYLKEELDMGCVRN